MKITNLFSRVRILHEEGFRVESQDVGKDIPHASCQTTWRRTCKSTRIFHPFLAYVFFWGEGVSDDGKMANHHFGSILGLLLFEYISIYEITLKVSLKSLDWQNGKMAKWANCFKQKSMGQILNQKRC